MIYIYILDFRFLMLQSVIRIVKFIIEPYIGPFVPQQVNMVLEVLPRTLHFTPHSSRASLQDSISCHVFSGVEILSFYWVKSWYILNPMDMTDPFVSCIVYTIFEIEYLLLCSGTWYKQVIHWNLVWLRFMAH